MHPLLSMRQALTRRQLLGRSASGLGTMALASLLNPSLFANPSQSKPSPALPGIPHFAPKAKRVIYLVQAGAPSQIETFDYKPELDKLHGSELPESIRKGQRLTTMTAGQGKFPVARSVLKFARQGKAGTWMSEILPFHGKIADDICVIRSVHTEAINHDQAITFFQTGAQQPGRPSFGSWLSYGLGSENADLPSFVVMTSIGTGRPDDQPLYDRLWGSGFLPTNLQGVRLRSGKDPVLYLSDPQGLARETRRDMLDDLASLNRLKHEAIGDPEITTRIAQYEMAFRMQMSVPEVMDLSKEPESVKKLYGPDVEKPGTFAANCLRARRLSERGVRFVQLYHRGWDHHGGLPNAIRLQARDTDQASAALILDLKARGLLDETLVIWGGEFGRTVYSQGALSPDGYGRDHHPRCFSLWMAGGGIKPGVTWGETDEFSYNIVRDPVHVHDLNATILHCLGIDHTRLTYKFQGRDFRLTDVHGEIIRGILA
ncbi:DUF1501 domain-containing protein [Tuwongella immobilis]|uniref:Sulfatase n=1 Tax=Tuwongella immobilis TaxID=692036 RepID=A0A6C2YRW3_9BACT|nr:DUF1501 domain-containing protein [Tuwongella immobilis]VIP04216.1 sulfatase : Uncharacterized protein OS=Solibacter usitatus (strain Ellin6076) GN=Acid_0975 PE=4 SV=1: DUF1501 [Tuwongella immobilis]VTS05796.1 sulfatase : Uncharacterized protein OS=Solibacter usitatus (strain Ellin6076) GN=Acid_0975 PE=4 SV=1: DUF1501 [Tuwongella immobilis]